jgi:pimeloyl-ACP methyl ester carboxylesterase
MTISISCDRQLGEMTLSCLEWRRGKEPVLLLHGMADHGLVWSSLGDALGDRYHVVAPDLRGHGNSTKPETGYYATDIITDLEALMDDLGWQSAHILGHSWSAKVAAIWATRSPQRFRSLILVDPFFIDKMPSWFKVTFPLLYRVLPFLKMMGPFPSQAAAQHQAQQLKQFAGWSALQQSVFHYAIAPQAGQQWGSKFVVQARDEIFEDVMQGSGLTEPLSLPTLFIQPEQGLNRFAWQMRSYHRYLTQLQIQRVPGNHWAFLVAPDAFNQAIRQFLEAHTSETS